MNLSTSRSTLRAKEIGIRKVAGAERKEIIFQFLSESILVSYISLVFAIALTWLTASLVKQNFRTTSYDRYFIKMADHCSSFADTFCCWDHIRNLPGTVHVFISANKSFERFFESRWWHFIQKSSCYTPVCHFYYSHHCYGNCFLANEIYAEQNTGI